jgi:hypothetical protein
MSSIQMVSPPTTFLEKAGQSKPVEFAKENPVLAGAAAVSGAVLTYQALDKANLTEKLLKVVEKGALPALGFGVGGIGAGLMYSAVTSDDPLHIAVAKGTGGAFLAVGGTEFGILESSPAGDYSKSILGKPGTYILTLGAAPATATIWAARDMHKNGINTANAALATLGANALGGVVAYNVSHKLVEKGWAATAAATLGLSAYAMGKDAYELAQKDHYTGASALALGSAASAAGSAALLGHLTGIDMLSYAGNTLIKHPKTALSVAVLGLTAAAYLHHTSKQPEEAAIAPTQETGAPHTITAEE